MSILTPPPPIFHLSELPNLSSRPYFYQQKSQCHWCRKSLQKSCHTNRIHFGYLTPLNLKWIQQFTIQILWNYLNLQDINFMLSFSLTYLHSLKFAKRWIWKTYIFQKSMFFTSFSLIELATIQFWLTVATRKLHTHLWPWCQTMANIKWNGGGGRGSAAWCDVKHEHKFHNSVEIPSWS